MRPDLHALFVDRALNFFQRHLDVALPTTLIGLAKIGSFSKQSDTETRNDLVSEVREHRDVLWEIGFRTYRRAF